MAQQLFRFTYPPELVNEPVVHRLATEFNLVTNIRRANVNKDRGWVILELGGEEEAVARAVRWAEQQGLKAEPLGDLPD